MIRCNVDLIDEILEQKIMMMRADTFVDMMLELNPNESVDHEDVVSFLTNYVDEDKALEYAVHYRDIYYPNTFTECAVCRKEIVDYEVCQCEDQKEGSYSCKGDCGYDQYM